MQPIQTKSISKDVSFFDGATTTGIGEIFEVGIYKTLTIEVYGTSATRTVQFFGRGKSGTNRALAGVRLSDLSVAASTTGSGELWQFDITGLDYVVLNISAISGGNVTVKGRVVA